MQEQIKSLDFRPIVFLYTGVGVCLRSPTLHNFTWVVDYTTNQKPRAIFPYVLLILFFFNLSFTL